MGRCLKVAGYVWLTAVVLLVLAGYISIWAIQGFATLREVMNPFNLWNTVLIIILLTPGALMVYGGKKISGDL